MKSFLTLLSLIITFNLFAFDATIVKINGECLVDGKKVETGSKVNQGQKLVTNGKGSYAVVEYENGTKFIIKEGSLQIKKLSKKQSLIGLFKGTFLSFVNGKDKKKKQENFKVLTKHASMGVRGTKFWAEVTNEETYLCVCEGEVEIKRDDKKMSVKRGQDIHVNKSNDLSLATANENMWNMALDGFKLMDVSVKPR